MISKFNYNVDYTLRQYRPLDDYKFDTNDHVKDLFLKYFEQVKDVNPDIKNLLIYRMNLPPNEVGELGDVFEYCRQLKGPPMIKKALSILEEF